MGSRIVSCRVCKPFMRRELWTGISHIGSNFNEHAVIRRPIRPSNLSLVGFNFATYIVE